MAPSKLLGPAPAHEAQHKLWAGVTRVSFTRVCTPGTSWGADERRLEVPQGITESEYAKPGGGFHPNTNVKKHYRKGGEG